MSATHEIEVKIIGIDRQLVESRLLALGARKVFDGEMVAVYFDFPDGALRRRRDVVRLRREGDRTVLAFKGFVSDEGAKIRREHETAVSDFDGARTVLEGLGLSPWLTMRKRRVSYALPDAQVEIDTYLDDHSFIPVFLEIEAASVDAVHRCAGLLGFRREDCRSWTFLDLAEHYRNRT